ncbi:MAG TPA: response regulator transcription factor [Vicinamibacterales bacterium]|nr:response regulator transcription factor [Vicinamibacterales bacterium]
MTTAARVSIVIADDHPIFRDGLRKLLEAESDMQVLAAAADADEAVRLTREVKPDVLLLDLAMRGRTGLDVLRDLAGEPGETRVIVLTAAITDAQTIEALELGARGVIRKEVATDLLMKAIRVVMNGEYWVGQQGVAGLVESLRRARQQRHEHAASRFGLTDRQMEILRLVVEGATNREVAKQLQISEETVKQHLTAIYDKCGVSSRVELARFATRHHLAGD